jgi:hypothetical protein
VFDPNIFPRVLSVYIILLSKVLNYIRGYCPEGAGTVPLVYAKAVTIIDYIANYCLIGNPRALIPSIIKPLGLSISLK